MKNLKRLSVLALLVLAVFTSSCKKDVVPENTKPNYSTDAKLDLGNLVNAKFFGVIADEMGNPISGVAIKAGNKTATTNSNGIFIIEDANVFEKLAYVSATKAGYFMGSRSVIPSTTATNNIRITMLDMNTVATVNSGEEKTVTLPGGAKIDFKGEFVDLSGNTYTGTVNIAFKHLAALAPETANQMPGMLYAQNQDEEAGVLETYGMMAVELTSSTGVELQIDPDSKAIIHMPVDASQLANAPATIPLWHFDEVAGYWIEEGEATLVGGEYVGDVYHFSFWNCDRFGDDAVVNGTVVDQYGTPLGNVSVSVITPFASTVGQTSSAGTFFTYVPANASITFEVLDDCGNSVSSNSAGPYAINSTNSEPLIATLNASNSVIVSGLFYDCNNNLITNGYITLTAGSEIYHQTITNGVINVPVLFCNIPSNLTVQGYDYDNIQETSSFSIPVTTPVTNLGNLIACNAVSEYITYSISGGAAITEFPPFTTNESSFVDSATSLTTTTFSCFGGAFELFSTSTTLGSYPWDANTGMSFYSSSINVNQQLPVNIIFQLVAYGAIGSYVDVTFSGNFTDNTGTNQTITGTVHVLRDA